MKSHVPDSSETKVDGALLGGVLNGDHGSMHNSDSGKCILGVNKVFNIIYILV